MAYSALSIANAFLDRAEKEGKELTNMKLQKLLYFAQGHSHALRNKRLIEEDCEAWPYGPVYPSVYHAFNRFGSSAITSRAADPDDLAWIFDDDVEPAKTPKNKDVNRFLDAVWRSYRDKTAARLSEMSHVSNGPWAKAFRTGQRGEVIDDKDIETYFKNAKAKADQKRRENETA